MPLSRPGALLTELSHALPDRPFEVRLWEGSLLPSTTGDDAPVPTFVAHSPRAIAHALYAPGQLGLSRAFVSGELEIHDFEALARLLRTWSPPPLDAAAKRRLAVAAVKAMGLQGPPRVPDAELQPAGLRHSLRRDSRAVRHHYDLSNAFFAHFLDPSMTYSCAIFETPEQPLEAAQANKQETVCRKLELAPGMRVLDVGCGWGAFALHAARNHGVHVTGITLSGEQAAEARRRVAQAGMTDQIEIRVQDYRELGGERFDAVSSIGMVEHVGAVNIDAYARTLANALEPGGWLLNHGIARLRHGDPEAGPFSERYVFADAAPLHLSRILRAIEAAGLAVRHAEGYPEHYARTLTRWVENLESDLEEAERLVGAERLRVWRLYLRGARNGFESGFMSVFQVRARKPA
ncbi:MAG: class I SAM-dependent methyltransferase [Solirubrobacterales bacterium]|nr:class I SAM-dependent methyltransferase [Solirubrobacterales bacterium]